MDPVATIIYAVAVLVTLDVAAVTMGRSANPRPARRHRRSS